MNKFMPLLLTIIPLLVVVVGLLCCGAAGFFSSSPAEARKTAVAGILLVALGICGIVWPLFVLIYPVLMAVALVSFALMGLYYAFGARK